MAAAMISCASLLLAGYWAAGIAHPALRAESMVAVAALGAAVVVGPSPRLLGPVATDGASRSVRRFGQLVIALCGLGLISGYRFEPRTDPIEQVTTGLPLLSAVLLAHILGGHVDDRAPVAARGPTDRRRRSRGHDGDRALLRLDSRAGDGAAVAVVDPGRRREAGSVRRCSWRGTTAPASQPSRRYKPPRPRGCWSWWWPLPRWSSYPPSCPTCLSSMLPSATAADRLEQSRSRARTLSWLRLLVGGLCAALAGTATVVQRRGPGPAGRRPPASL